jgi:hypothetical protein
MPSTENTVKITNVSPGDCIPLNFDVHVHYTNAYGVEGTVYLDCDGGPAVPAHRAAPGDSGTLAFNVSHGAMAANHTLTAKLTHNADVATDTVGSVGVGDPCPIIIDNPGPMFAGLPSFDPDAGLSGKFDSNKGDKVVVIVEKPLIANGVIMDPVLVFVHPAETWVEKVPQPAGRWRHAKIKVAKAGYHLRVVLTQDGVVKSVAHGIFK